MPYLESDSGKRCKLRKYFSKHIYVSQVLNNMKSSSVDYSQENESLELEINVNILMFIIINYIIIITKY